MEKLVVVIMGQNSERFLSMCLESVKEADAIVYCDGGSTDNTIDIMEEFIGIKDYRKQLKGKDNPHGKVLFTKSEMISNKYNQEDPQMNGKQRNFYLKYIKENYPDYWCLAIDTDEVLEDMETVKKFINEYPPGLYGVRMRHLIGDLAHEDSLTNIHITHNRLFKISEASHYPLKEHPILIGKKGIPSKEEGYQAHSSIVLWHLSYIPNMWEIKNKYQNHLKKSTIHTPEYLKNWYFNHLFGQYPRKPFNPVELPRVILEEFGIDKDELYFANRKIELKHAFQVKEWNDYFKPKSVLDLGCGRGCYLYFWQWFVGSTEGAELSDWAVKNRFAKRIHQGNITNYNIGGEWDLITCVDVLEHLTDDELDKALRNISGKAENYLFSICFKTDPNLERDPTHKQAKTRKEWKELIESHGIEIKLPPKEWLFAHQIFIGKNK